MINDEANQLPRVGNDDDLGATITDHFLAFVVAGLVIVGRWGIERITNPDQFGAVVGSEYYLGRNIYEMLWELRTWLLVSAAAALPFLYIRPAIPQTNLLCAIFQCLFLYLIVSSIWSPADNVWPKILDTIDLMGLIALVTIGARSEHFFRLLVLYFFVLLAPLAGVSMVALASGTLTFLSGTVEEESTRLSVLAGGANTLGRLFAMLSVLCLHASIGHHTPIKRAIFAIATPFAIVLLVATGSRGAALGSMVAIPLLLLMQGTSRLLLFAAAAFTMAVAVLSGLVGLPGDLAEIAEDRWIMQTLNDRYDAGRTMLAQAGLEVWLEHPLFGAGLDSFSKVAPHTGERYAHNLAIEILQEGGLVGFTLLLFAACVAAWNVTPLKNRHVALWLALFVQWFVSSMFSGELYDSRNVFVFSFLAVAASKLLIHAGEKPAVASPPRGLQNRTAIKF